MASHSVKRISLDDLHRASLELHSLRSEAAIIERLRELSEEMTGSPQSFVYLVDPRYGELYGTRSASEEEVRFGPDQGIAGWVAQNREVWTTDNVGSDPLFSEQVDCPPGQTPSLILASPILVTGKDVIGVLMLLDKADGPYDDDDELFTALLCEHAASAIQMGRDFDATTRFASDLAAAVGASVDVKSVATVDHSTRVAATAVALGKAMGLGARELAGLEFAAQLHDVGRLELASLPGAEPGESGSIERQRNHIFFTEALLKRVHFPDSLPGVLDTAISHHEAVDGSGFPRGEKGDEMSLAAKILQVTNAFDVVAFQRRSQIKGDPVKVALGHLQRNRGTLFAEDVVDTFIAGKLYEVERRRHARYEYEVPLDVNILSADGTEGETHQTVALDISEGGLLFRFDREIKPLELVRLLMHLPSDKVEALAKVARCIPDGDSYKIGAFMVWQGSV